MPKEYGAWHVIYVRVSRWAKRGVVQEAFVRLQQLCKQSNQVERLFRRLKRFCRIFTRYDKLDVIFFLQKEAFGSP